MDKDWEVIYLRPIREEDVDNILSWVNNTEIVGNIAAFSGEPFTREQELAYIKAMQESDNDLVFSIFKYNDTDYDDIYLGQVGIHQIHPRSKVGRLSIVIGDRENWGKRYGTAALLEICTIAFEVEKLHKLWLMVNEVNSRARVIYRNVGFQEEGVLREEYFHLGIWHNMVRMSLLASEWAALPDWQKLPFQERETRQ